MTKGAGILNITGRVVEGAIRPGPTILRVGIVRSVAGFTTGSANAVDAEIKAWIAAGAAWLTMAGLANRQVRLGVGAVSAATEIRAINWVWCSGATSVTTATVKAVRGTARRCLVALQILSVTCLTGVRCVRRYITTVIGIWIRPC